MSLLHVLLILVIIGVVMWIVERFFPMNRTIKTITEVVFVLCTIVWLLGVFHIIRPMAWVRP